MDGLCVHVQCDFTLCKVLSVIFAAIGLALVLEKVTVGKRHEAHRAHKVLRMPNTTKCRQRATYYETVKEREKK